MTLSGRRRNIPATLRFDDGYLLPENSSRNSNYLAFATPQLTRKSQFTDLFLNNEDSPSVPGIQNQNNLSPIENIRSRSFEIIPNQALAQQLTNDSGTGESLILPIDQHHTTNTNYDTVRIFGQGTKASICNRYEFDQSLVDDYIKRKYKIAPMPPMKPSTHSPSHSGGRFGRWLDRITKSSKPSRNISVVSLPLVRHHPSNEQTDES